MKTYPTIWFLRHGQTEWNKAYRLQGQLDSPLTAQGRGDALRQARLIAPILAQAPDVYVSPLGRTVETAAIALRGCAYKTDDRLMEIHAGAWQGHFRDDIIATHPEWLVTNPTALEIYQAAEHGEGLATFQARIISFLDDLSGPSVIVAHGLWGQVMRAFVCGIDMAVAGQLSNQQGCVYVLENGQESIMESQQ